MPVPSIPMSCPSTYRKANKGVVCTDVLPLIARSKRDGFHICVYLAFPLSCLPTFQKVKEGLF